jgi:L-ascorbate metabolism protein UlaG (beta-lactamase superfamily)
MRRTFFLLVVTTLLAFGVYGCTANPTPASEQPAAAAPGPTEVPMSGSTLEPNETAPETAVLLARLHWYGQASFRLDGPPTIYFDPVVDFGEDAVPADIILITHAHGDHYDPATLKQISSAETVIITTQAIADTLAKDGVPGEVRVLAPGGSTTVGEIEIEGVPAYNIDKRYHPKEDGNLGFILRLDGLRLYHAGDTDVIPEMVDFHPDVALIPIGGTYTMNPAQAVEAVAALLPQVVVPMHILADSNLTAFQKLCDCNLWVMEVEE